MRLICPNCGAQYEVDDSLVPDSGRDVQCSNCGHAWFQRPPHLDSALADELGTDLPEEVPEEAEEIEAEPVKAEPVKAESSRLDPEVRNILEEESERETKARRADAGIETQDELGLDEGGKTPGVRERMARLRGLDVDERAENAAAAVAAATAAGSRRDLLPDIEEINSSLRSADERESGAEELPPRRKRSGFSFGFMLVLILAFVAVAVYAFADKLAEAVPAAAPALSVYVAWANELRGWLDTTVRGWVEKLRG
jgi:predicted Zn finger-like uncharacterized protein